MITISTNKYISYIPVQIDGVNYKVRRMGAGEQLDISQILSEMQKLKVDALNDKVTDEVSQKTVEKFSKLSEKLEKVLCQIFEDENNGKDAEKLVHKLGADNVIKLLTDIFEQTNNE